MTTTDDQYVPTEEDMEERYVRHSLALVDFPRGDRPEWEQKLREEFRRGLARVRRDAARAALDGLYEDASQEYRIGLQGDDQERMDAAEAVLRATYAWLDNYPEETP